MPRDTSSSILKNKLLTVTYCYIFFLRSFSLKSTKNMSGRTTITFKQDELEYLLFANTFSVFDYFVCVLVTIVLRPTKKWPLSTFNMATPTKHFFDCLTANYCFLLPEYQYGFLSSTCQVSLWCKPHRDSRLQSRWLGLHVRNLLWSNAFFENINNSLKTNDCIFIKNWLNWALR